MLTSNDYEWIGPITGTARHRRWTTEQKLRIIEATFIAGEMVSSLARRHGVMPILLFRWRAIDGGGSCGSGGSDEPVVGNSAFRELESRVYDLERLLGRKTMEVDKEALATRHRQKKAQPLARCPASRQPRAGVEHVAEASVKTFKRDCVH